MSLHDPFTLAMVALLALSLLGLPIGLAMITATIVYLGVSGQDMSVAAEQVLNGLNGSYVLLAVPLFIFSAGLMNAGSLTDRLLRFCNLLVGRSCGLGHVNVVQSVIFAGMPDPSRRCRGSGKVQIDMMTKAASSGELRRRADRGDGGDRADHPAVDPDGALRARRRCLDRLPVPGRRDPWPSDGDRADGHQYLDGPSSRLPGRRARTAARVSAFDAGGAAGIADAGDPARWNLRRRDDADRSRTSPPPMPG